MAHHIKVRSDTNRTKLTQHMAQALREHGRVIISAAEGQAARNMQWSLSALDGFFEGYAVVRHSRIKHEPGNRGGDISIIEWDVSVAQEEDQDAGETEEDRNP